MANVKITELTAATALAGTDVLPIVDVGADATKKVSVSDLLRNLPDGTASAPALAFADDQNTGVLSPGDNSLAFATSGTQRLVIDSAGKFGFGTSTVSTAKFTFNSAGTNEVARFESTDAGAYLSLKDSTSSSINFIEGGADQLSFGTNNSERMRIDSSGNVGIGTTSIDRLLHVQGAGTSGTQVQIEGTSASAGLKFVPASGDNWEVQATTDSALIVYNRTDTAERLRIDSSGRLLVGVSSTSAASTAIFGESSAANGPSIVYFSSSHTTPADGAGIGLIRFSAANHVPTAQIAARRDGGTWTAGSSQPSRIEFSTTADGASSPTERMRITSTGQMRLAGAGITFNGDTATANELDDYEEGTWTPSVEFGGATTGITYNARQGFYVKTGKIVHVWFYFNMSNKGSATGTATVAGLPFTSEDFNVSGLTVWPGSKPSRRQNETSSDFAMSVLENSSEVSISNGAGSAVTDSTFTNGTIIECSLCYRAA